MPNRWGLRSTPGAQIPYINIQYTHVFTRILICRNHTKMRYTNILQHFVQEHETMTLLVLNLALRISSLISPRLGKANREKPWPAAQIGAQGRFRQVQTDQAGAVANGTLCALMRRWPIACCFRGRKMLKYDLKRQQNYTKNQKKTKNIKKLLICSPGWILLLSSPLRAGLGILWFRSLEGATFGSAWTKKK